MLWSRDNVTSRYSEHDDRGQRDRGKLVARLTHLQLLAPLRDLGDLLG